jgi:hypothetical protein
LAEGDKRLAALIGRNGGEEVKGNNVVKSLRRARKCPYLGSKVRVANVCVHAIDLRGRSATRTNGKPALLKHLRNVGREKALDSINSNVVPIANPLLCFCDKAAATCTYVKNALTRL